MTQIAFYITSFILDDDVPYHGDNKKLSWDSLGPLQV